MSAQIAATLDEAAIIALGLAAFVAIVTLLDRIRQPGTSAPSAPRIRGPRAGVRRTERELPPDPAAVENDWYWNDARDATTVIELAPTAPMPDLSQWGTHEVGGVR